MKKEEEFSAENYTLRQKAEMKLELNRITKFESMTESDRMKLIHELQVHQIELEMQAEELQQAILKASTATALYDLAPNGYFTISPDGTICELNITGAKMLAKERSSLINSNISFFMTLDTRSEFLSFLKNVFESNTKQTCEARLLVQEIPTLFVHIDGIVSDKGLCHLSMTDITERKQKEEELKNNFSLLRTAGKTAKFGGWVADLVHNKVIWSDEVAAIHEMPSGYSPSIPDGINFYAPDFQKKIASVFKACAEEGIPYDEDMELITGKGNRVWVRTTGEATRNNKGEITSVQGSFQEITYRKINQAINASLLKLIQFSPSRSLDDLLEEIVNEAEKLSGSQIGFIHFVNENQDHISLQNWSTRTKNQYCKAEGKGLHYAISEAGIWADCVRQGKPLIHNDYASLAHRKGMPEGHAQVIRELVVPVFREKKIKAIFGFGNKPTDYTQKDLKAVSRFTDFAWEIVERKIIEEALNKSENIFHQFLTHSPIYVFFKDENLHSLRLSKNYEQMLGKPLNELLGKTMDELFPSDLAKSMDADDLKILKEGKKIEIEEEYNGRIYTSLKFPIAIKGKPTYLAGYTIDITEHKRAENNLKANEIRLRELNATKDKFFSIIAHDLKSPFNSILGFSNLLVGLVQEKNYEAIEEIAKNIQNSSEQAFNLLINLLEWSRSQTGKIKFTPELIDMNVLINKEAELLNDTALGKSITIYTELPASLNMFADQAMIRTILRNLISNAIKFSRTNGEIIVSAKQEQNEVLFYVKDCGVGIRKEAIEKLFRIDQSYSTPGTNNEKGTGLGLLLCKEFIDMHSGKIWVESEIEKGSTFYFTIPKGSNN